MFDRKRRFNGPENNGLSIPKKNKSEIHVQYNPSLTNIFKNDNIQQTTYIYDDKEIKQLKKNQKILEKQNQDLSDQIEQLKFIIINLEEMFKSLRSEMIDMQRNCYMETSPIDPSYCSYLS